MNSFEDIAKKEYEKSNNDIFPFIFEEKQYWLKKARATKPDKIQKFFYKFFPFELLIPPIVKSSKEALLYEISKLEKFKELGINVPVIAYKCEDFFVLEDSGNSVNAYLRSKDISEDRFYFFVDKLIFELSKIHNCSTLLAYLVDESNEKCVELFVDVLLDSSQSAPRAQPTHQAYDRPGQIAPLALERVHLIFVIHVPFQL